MESTVLELKALQQKLECRIAALQAELQDVERVINIYQREKPEADLLGATTSPGRITSGNDRLSAAPVSTSPPADATPQNGNAGLTELCLGFVSDEWVYPVAVRDYLCDVGYHNKDKAKLLSSVYATLQRLLDRGKLERAEINGKTAYRKVQHISSEAA